MVSVRSLRSVAAYVLLPSLFLFAGCGGGSSSGGGGRRIDNPPSPGTYMWQSAGGPNVYISTVDNNGGVSAATNIGGPVNPRTEYPGFAPGPSNRFLYALDTNLGAIRVFSLVGPGVLLSEDNGSPFRVTTGGDSMNSLRVDSAEKFLYLVKTTAIDVYSISSKGVPTRTSGVTEASDFREAAIAPSGKFLFVNDLSGSRIFGYQIGSDGSLTGIQGSPFSVSAGGPRHIVIDSSGKYLYAGITSGGVAAFAIDATTGALIAISGSPFSTSGPPTGMVASSSFIYLSSESGAIDGFLIGSSGALTEVPSSPFGSGTSSSSIVVDSSGQFVYVANKQASTIYAFRIDSSTGRLTVLGGSPFTSVTNPTHLVPMKIQ